MSEKTTKLRSRAKSTLGKNRPSVVPSEDATMRGLTVAKPIRILLAEDDDEMRNVIALHLAREGYQVTECRDGMQLLNHLEGYVEKTNGAKRFDLIVSDIRMPGVMGLTIAEGAAECEGFPPIILITAFGDAQTHQAAEKYGVRAVLDKPFQIPVLLDIVRENIPG